jgi:uncharacterized protein
MTHMKTLKLFAVIALATWLSGSAAAQGQPNRTDASHRIVFQLTTADTMAHKGMMKQLKNILAEDPSIQMEVVCHGPGMDMLRHSKSTVKKGVEEFTGRGVVFNACENTMRERNIPREDILPAAGYVKAGIIYIVQKQEQGWSYIKAGF